ncbi:sulfotransferase [Pseudoxanthomonas sp. Root630]|uniref:sulfotransferase family protein n=1 Tax=Pseudoxanthomonas sp. Root630 TaxID=1736574 RepID=UPI000A655894|nr:sulfotransferase [Pseudoxanthomonas sp. Root630]
MNARRMQQHACLADALREAAGTAPTGHVRRRVFIVGCPRSGTTLLQSLLHAHRQIRSLPETHFLPLLLGSEEHRRCDADRPRAPVARLRRWRRDLFARWSLVEPRRAARAWSFLRSLELPAHMPGQGRWRLGPQLRAFVHTLDAHALAMHKPIWVEKTPDHLFYIDHLSAAVDDARFIHVQREGRQVVGSLYRAAREHPGWRPFLSLEKCVDRWETAWRESERWRGDARHLHVSHDALVRAPGETLARVLAFLGCDADDTLWSRYRSMANGLIRADEPWKAGNLQPLRARDAFGDVLDASQRDWVESALATRAASRTVAHAPASTATRLTHTGIRVPHA